MTGVGFCRQTLVIALVIAVAVLARRPGRPAPRAPVTPSAPPAVTIARYGFECSPPWADLTPFTGNDARIRGAARRRRGRPVPAALPPGAVPAADPGGAEPAGAPRAGARIPAALRIDNAMSLHLGGRSAHADNDQFHGAVDDVWLSKP